MSYFTFHKRPRPDDPPVVVSQALDNELGIIERRRQKRLKRLAKRIVARTKVFPPPTPLKQPIDDIQVRSFQKKLFELAKHRNLIICLPTGSGKTLISVLLLQHVKHLEQVVPSSDSLCPVSAADNAEQDVILDDPDEQGGSPVQDPDGDTDEDDDTGDHSDSSALSAASPRRRGKVSFFLVNLVPLVHQQASVIAAFSELGVGKVYGELKDEILDSKLRIDTWRKPEWDALLQAHDVVVATAQCLLAALIHAYVRMEDINLLVFDEAHHAIKSHPYARIMLYYRLAERKKQPRILGLTASPVFSLGDYGEASKLLEQTMDAEIVTAPNESQVDLKSVVNCPVEFVAEYDAVATDGASVEPTALSLLIRERCENLSTDFSKSVWPRIEYSMLHHGPLMTDLVWHGSMQKTRTRVQRLQAKSRQHSSKHALLDHAWGSTAALQSIIGAEVCTSQLSTDASLNRAMLAILDEQPPLPATLSLSPHTCSPKILRLVEILRCLGSGVAARATFCGIIFVQRRQTAASLAELLCRVPDLCWLKPEWLIGHNPSNGPAMDWHDQVEVLDRFRRRAPTNLLIATSVAEEGLDIQAANVVIRFDLFDRHSGFLQSKGRARSLDSRFIIMAERRNLVHYRIIASATLTEMGRSDWLAKLAEKTGTAERLEVKKDELGYNYFVDEPLTGARLYPQDAPNIVSHYVGQLRVEQESASFARPEFDVLVDDTVVPTTFQCHLKLPANSKLREVLTERWPTKRAAKHMAALQACQKLRELDLLDEHLMPRTPFRPMWDPANRDSNDVIYASAVPSHMPTRMLHFKVRRGFEGWKMMPPLAQALPLSPKGAAGPASEPIRAFASLLPLDRISRAEDQARYRSLFLVTSQPLPPTALLHLYEAGSLADIGQVGQAAPIELIAEQFEAAQRFTEVLFGWLTRKRQVHDGRALFLVLPALAHDASSSSSPSSSSPSAAAAAATAPTTEAIDWSAVSAVTSDTVRNAGDMLLDDVFDAMLIDRRDLIQPGSFFVEEVRRDLTPFSEPPAGTKEAERGSTSYFEYYRITRARFSSAEVLAPRADQPMLRVKLLKPWRSQLVPPPSSNAVIGNKAQKRMASRLVIPTTFYVHPLPLSIARSGLLLPSVLYRYDDLLLAQHCNLSLFSGRISTDLVLAALTPPSREAGFDYERLEFYGDTVLKLLAACQVFTTRPSETEGELHVASKEILVNRVLERHAMRLKLWKWVRFSDKWMKRKDFWFQGWREVDGQGAAMGEEELEEACEIDGTTATEPQHAGGSITCDVGHASDDSSTSLDRAADAKLGPRLVDVDESVPLQDRDEVGGKTLSDMVEALLGASLFHSGLYGALLTAVSLSVLPSNIISPTSFYDQLTSLLPAPDPAWRSRVDTSALSHLERLFNYTFASPHLALEAFTHPSLLASVLPSYQRLEYLGDAFLDYCVILKIHQLYPTLDQGEATALKSNMVSNATLSALCELLDLTNFIASQSASLKSGILAYIEGMRQLRLVEEAKVQDGQEGRQYWWTLKNPKAVADVVESSLGAVLVDAKFDFERAREVFEGTYWPWLDRWCSPEKAVVPNVKVLAGLLMGRKACSCWSLELRFAILGLGQEVAGLVYIDDDDDDEKVAEAIHCRIWSCDVIIGEKVEKIRSDIQREALKGAIRQIVRPSRKDGSSDKAKGGQTTLRTFRTIIKTLRWARPFDSSASFPAIEAQTPPRLVDVLRCGCHKAPVEVKRDVEEGDAVDVALRDDDGDVEMYAT